MPDFKIFSPTVLIIAAGLAFLFAGVLGLLTFLAPCTLHGITDWAFCPDCGLALNSYCPVCFDVSYGNFCVDCGSPVIIP